MSTKTLIDESEHFGSRSCYQQGCRLPQCVEANRAYAEELRREAGMEPKKIGRTCGLSGYMAGHRCEICREEYAEYRKEKRHEKRDREKAASDQ